MAWITRLKTFYRRIFQRAQVEQDLDAEVQAYFKTLVDRYMDKGMSREEAHRTARLKFDGAEQVKQTVRDEQVGATIEAILRDMHYAVRMMAKNPGFTIVTVVTLALGNGGSTGILKGLHNV